MDAERVKRVLIFSSVGNAAISFLKIFGGIVSGSTALLADGSDSMLNVASAAVSYCYYSRSLKPPDDRHPYGHTRFEAYGSIVILLLMAVTFSFIGFTALDRFSHGEPEKVSPIGVAFAVLSLLLNLGVSSLLRAYGRGSQIALTESRHTSLDVAEGVTTLAGVTLGSTVSAYFDLAATVVILGIVAFFIYGTLRELQGQIIDTSPPPEILRAIEEEALKVRGVRGVHSLRARVAGDKIYADLHLEVDPRLPVDEAHELCDHIERAVSARLGGRVDLTIHVEPSSG
ncbi:cation transporter [Infirmifilum lucidum]|uniref:Cation transporter n=1 Tax=Infirmifilum lucidum TaxID=2776706 RepID=A0A7L9FIS8_9CREN|nr:cation diffusion facilitator family transporter [Infirmifilum lucidum]QOJ78933.1 cation transporter [Infirmifilum lucidum]